MNVTEQWQQGVNILHPLSRICTEKVSHRDKCTFYIGFRTAILFDWLPKLCFIIFQWATFHARVLCGASCWESWWNAAGGRLRNRERDSETQKQRLSQHGFSSVCWMSVFHLSRPPSIFLGFTAAWTVCLHMCFFALSYIFSDEWKWIIHRGWHSQTKARCLCNSCCGTHLSGSI